MPVQFSDLKLELGRSRRENQLLKRLSVLQSTAKKAKSTKFHTWRKKIFNLNVFPGEYDSQTELVFHDEISGQSQDIRYLKNQVNDLEQALQTTVEGLAEATENIAQKDSTLENLAQRNSFLTNRLSAAERDADQSYAVNQQLSEEVQQIKQQQEAADKERTKVLGRKRINDLAPSQVILH